MFMRVIKWPVVVLTTVMGTVIIIKDMDTESTDKLWRHMKPKVQIKQKLVSAKSKANKKSRDWDDSPL